MAEMTLFTVRVPVQLLGVMRELARRRSQTVSDVARDAFEREAQVAALDLRDYWRDLERVREDLELLDRIEWVEKQSQMGHPVADLVPIVRAWLLEVESR